MGLKPVGSYKKSKNFTDVSSDQMQAVLIQLLLLLSNSYFTAVSPGFYCLYYFAPSKSIKQLRRKMSLKSKGNKVKETEKTLLKRKDKKKEQVSMRQKMTLDVASKF